MQTTFEVKLALTTEQEVVLAAMARHLSFVERELFASLYVKKENASLAKSAAITNYGVTARHVNAILFNLKGRIAAATENQKNQIDVVRGKLKSATQAVKNLARDLKKAKARKQPDGQEIARLKFSLHQKSRRQQTLADRLQQAQLRLQADVPPRLCFGSRKLFHAQHDLKANGYQDHAEWKAEWDFKRHSQFFLVGRACETFGNQSAQYEPTTQSLTIRLTSEAAKLNSDSKRLTLPHITFSYGQTQLEQAIANAQPISYRFIARQVKRQVAGQQVTSVVWYVKVSIEQHALEILTDKKNGVIGIDLNPTRINLGFVKADGNPLDELAIPTNLTGKSSNQVTAILSDAVKQIVNEAVSRKCPIAVERLDFSEKKKTLGEANTRYARMLSSFAYNKFFQLLTRRAEKFGVQVVTVNPAYTSVIGYAKFGAGYGYSIDGAAAISIARRALNLGERLSSRSTSPSLHKILMEARTRRQEKHVWSGWAVVKKGLGTDRACLARSVRRECG